MKYRKFVYSMLPIVGIAGLLGANAVSAHGFFGGFGGFMNQLTPDQIAVAQQNQFQNTAELLGISVDDVKSAWAEGKSVQDIMKEKGISQDQVQVRMKDAQLQQLKTQLQALVGKGVITQAQADQRLSAIQTRMQKQRMPRMRKMHRGWFGF